MTTASPMHGTTKRTRGRVVRLLALPAAAALALGASVLGVGPASAAPGPDRAPIVTPVADPATDIQTIGGPSADATIVMPWDGLDPAITVWANQTPFVEGDSVTATLTDGAGAVIAGPVEGVFGEALPDVVVADGSVYPVTFSFPGLWLPEGATVVLRITANSQSDFTPGFGLAEDETLVLDADALPATPTDWLGYLDQVDSLIVGVECVIGEPLTIDLPEAVEGLAVQSAWNAETGQFDVTLTSLDGYTLAAGDAESFALNFEFVSADDPSAILDVSAETVTFSYLCGDGGTTEGGPDIAPEGGTDDTTADGGADLIVDTAPAADAPELAATGTSAQPMALGGIVLLVMGAGILLLTRRTGARTI